MADIELQTSQNGIKKWRGRADGTALVESTSHTSEEARGHDGDSYIFHCVSRTAAAAAGGFLHISNTSAVDSIVVGRIYVDPQTLTDADLLCTQWTGITSISGGTDITSTGVVQKNSARVNALKTSGVTLTCSDASSDMTFTGGTKFHEFPLVSRTPAFRDMKSTNVIGPGRTWGLGWKLEDGSNAVDNQIVSFGVNCYLLDLKRE